MSRPIPVWENDWKGWTSESCIKNGHLVGIMFCIGCGKPKEFILKEAEEDKLKLTEPIAFEMEKEGEEYKVIEDT